MESRNEHDVGSSIAKLADQCRQSLEACTQNEALMQYEWAENRLAEFKLWAAGTGAFASEKASLDARLSVDWETKELIGNLLVLLTGCIKKCQMIVTSSQEEAFEEPRGCDAQDNSASIGNQSVPDQIPRAFSPWSDLSSTDLDSEEENLHVPLPNSSALQSAKIEVEQTIDYLSRLAVAVRKSGTTSRYQRADHLFTEEHHQDLFQHLVVVVLSRGSKGGREQYEIESKSLNAIQRRLIMSNLRRRNRFIYAQKHARKLAFDAPNSTNLFEMPAFENLVLLNSEHCKIQLSRPYNTQIADEQANLHGTRARFPTAITATSASAIGTTIARVPQQMPALSQMAKTNITSISAKVDYPRPPRLQEGLRYFQCPCCCQVLPSMFREGTQWKKHLAEDICPYTCFIDDCICPERLYASRKDWLRHVEKDHSRCWECLPCRKHGQPSLVFTSVEDFIKHTNTHHGDSITKDQHPTLISAAARPAPFGISQCPLCDQTGPADSDELLDHIAEHVHSFSLRSLPWPRDELDTRGDEPSFFDDHDYFEEGSSGQSYNVSSNSERDTEDVASLSSNASSSQRGFSTDMDEAPAEPMKDMALIQELFRYQHYKIAIICASSLEVRAVCTLFEETYAESLKLLDDDGPDEYALGRLGDHQVVVACRRSNDLGRPLTSLATQKIRRNFPATEWFIHVGIGGGIPSDEHDIRLGDVVVSTGIVRLDMGQVTQGGAKMKMVELLRKPSRSWLAVIHENQPHTELVLRALEINAKHIARVWPSYKSPGTDRDKLFPANSKHTFGQETCENCKDARVLRKSRPFGPQVHFGLTASVNGTMKDAEIRDRIGSETGVLCFEREDDFNATGAINYLTILGICDYADSHSNNEWRGYAAATAAAYIEGYLLRTLHMYMTWKMAIHERVEESQ